MNMQLDVSGCKGSLPPYMQNLSTIHLRGNSVKFIEFERSEVGKERLRKLREDCRVEME